MDPDQTAPSSLIWVHTVCKMTKNYKQVIKQTTIVVIGSFRVKVNAYTLSIFRKCFTRKTTLELPVFFSAYQSPS